MIWHLYLAMWMNIYYTSSVINYAQKDFIVLVYKKSDVYLNGLTIDLVRNGFNEGFDFRNSNERDSCGENFRLW